MTFPHELARTKQWRAEHAASVADRALKQRKIDRVLLSNHRCEDWTFLAIEVEGHDHYEQTGPTGSRRA